MQLYDVGIPFSSFLATANYKKMEKQPPQYEMITV